MKINVFIEKNGLNSKGVYDTSDETILVLKGSVISNQITPHFKDSSYDVLRNDLIKGGIILKSKRKSRKIALIYLLISSAQSHSATCLRLREYLA